LACPLRAQDASTYNEHQNLSYYQRTGGERVPVKSVEHWEVRRAHILAHMQTVMGPLPRPEAPVPLDVQTYETTSLDNSGLVRKKISYHTDDPARTVSAYLFIPGHADNERLPAVLCLHQTIGIGKQEPAGLGGNPNLHYALHLAQRGYVTLAPDYPSFGDYEYDFDADAYVSGTMKATYDNIRAVDLLQSLPEVDGERIGVIGHSLGGHNAMFTAAFEPRIKAIVSNCGFTRFHKYYEGKLAGWTSARYMPRIASEYHNNPDEVPFDFTEIVAAFAPRPFLASSPLHDSNFEVSGVRDVIEAAYPIYALYNANDKLDANYPDCQHDFPEEVRDVAYRFLDRHLKGASR
jgi:pimeloyl-ACP methyl ester carboxylesterase